MTDETPTTNRSGAEGNRLDVSLWLLGSLAILLFAACLEARADGLVGIYGTICLPETCMLKQNFCLLCPGCGLTRSFIHMAQGDLPAAWRVNWVGVFGFCFTLAQLPIAMAYLLRIQGPLLDSIFKWNSRGLIGLAALLILRWAYLLFTGNLYAYA